MKFQDFAALIGSDIFESGADGIGVMSWRTSRRGCASR